MISRYLFIFCKDNIMENVDMSMLSGDENFSSDDSSVDPNFTPEKISRKRKVYEETATCSKRIRTEFSVESSKKLIFSSTFYTDIKEISDQARKSCTAKCVKCEREIKGSLEVSSNFITHLRVRHRETYEHYKVLKNGKFEDRNAQEVFNSKLLFAIVDSALPVSILDRKSFVDSYDGNGMKVMCRQTAMKKLEVKHETMFKNIRSSMASAKHFCTTADVWSGNHKSFLGYTCHWLTDEMERKSVALACKRICGIHSAEKLTQIISEINSSFGLNSSNIVMTVTDNGSNFVKAFKEYGVVPDVNDDDNDDDLPQFENECFLPRHQRCASHTLNLLASTDFLKILKADQALFYQHTKTFGKCNTLWKKNNRSKSSEVIVSTLGSSLIVPVVTRWNSLFDAVQRLLQHKDKLGDLCDRLSLPQFTSVDLEHLESYKMLMEPIAHALDLLQGEKEAKFGCLIPTLMTLSNRLTKLSKSKNLFEFSSIATKLGHQLRERFQP